MADAGAWFLAIDLGTGGPKTGAVGLDGRVLASAHHAVETRYLPGGGAVQDPNEWWRKVVAGVRAVVAEGVLDAERLAGVGITGQWGSTVPVAEDSSPAGDCLLWADTRGRALSARTLGGPLSVVGYSPGNLVAWMRLTGGAPSPHGADPLGHELHLRERERDVYARTTTLMEPLDYLALRLTGRRAATPASMILSWLTDNRRGGAAAYAAGLVRRSTRDAGRLPPLLATGATVGGILPEVAAELGVRAGAPVVAGVPDLHTAWIGSGAVAPFAAHLTISTTAWISCEVPFKKTDVLHQMASVPGLREGSYLVANNHETAGLCLQWFRDTFAPGATYDALTAEAARAPAGAGGVLFMPWLNGERSPVEDRDLRAGFANLGMDSDRPRLVRAVLEGVAHNARWLLDAVEGFAGRRFDSLRILGGGARSDLWCQVHADVLDRPLERVADPMFANLRGAGLYAAVALGHLDYAAAARLVPVDRRFEPEAAHRAVYDRHQRQFARLYGRLAPVYRALNRDRA